MSKLDAFVKVKYQRKLSQFSDIDYDTVVVLSSNKVGVDGKIDENTLSTTPLIFSTASGFPETLSTNIKNIGKCCLEHGKRVCFWDQQLENKYCYLFAEYLSSITTWDKTGEGNDKFMLVFPSHLYDDTNAISDKYQEKMFTGTTEDSYDSTVGSRIVVCGSERKSIGNNLLIAASVAGVIAGGYRNFTTHLRQIIQAKEDRQLANPSVNLEQSKYIGCVILAGNAFIEGSMTYGVKSAGNDDKPINRKYIDRQVLEDRL
jgi:hypothetical protein